MRILPLSVILALALSITAQTTPPQQRTQPPQTTAPAATQPVTPEAFWDALLRGNRQFTSGRITYDQLTTERAQLRDHQNPPVTILSCSDSRVPPELIFNQSIGSLFVIRTAGNVADEYGLASIEFAIANGYTKLLVVLGHEACGAVKASLAHDDPPTPSLRQLAERIRMSFIGIPWNAKDPATFRRAIEANARAAAAALPAQSTVVRDAAFAGTLQIVPAYYDFGTGEVRRVD